MNVLGGNEFSRMPKNKPTVGPMRTQPIERGSIMPTQMSPLMPTVGMGKTEKAPQPKEKLTKTEAVRAAKARMMRLGSLLKQREALKK